MTSLLTCLVPRMAAIIRGTQASLSLQPLHMASLDFLTGVVIGQTNSLYGSWLTPEQHSKRRRQNLQSFLMLFNSHVASLPPHSISQPRFKGRERHKVSIPGGYTLWGKELSLESSYYKPQRFPGMFSSTCVWGSRGKTSHLQLAQSSVKIRWQNKLKKNTHYKGSVFVQPSKRSDKIVHYEKKKVKKFLLEFGNSQSKQKTFQGQRSCEIMTGKKLKRSNYLIYFLYQMNRVWTPERLFLPKCFP